MLERARGGRAGFPATAAPCSQEPQHLTASFTPDNVWGLVWEKTFSPCREELAAVLRDLPDKFREAVSTLTEFS